MYIVDVHMWTQRPTPARRSSSRRRRGPRRELNYSINNFLIFLIQTRKNKKLRKTR